MVGGGGAGRALFAGGRFTTPPPRTRSRSSARRAKTCRRAAPAQPRRLAARRTARRASIPASASTLSGHPLERLHARSAQGRQTLAEVEAKGGRAAPFVARMAGADLLPAGTQIAKRATRFALSSSLYDPPVLIRGHHVLRRARGDAHRTIEVPLEILLQVEATLEADKLKLTVPRGAPIRQPRVAQEATGRCVFARTRSASPSVRSLLKFAMAEDRTAPALARRLDLTCA